MTTETQKTNFDVQVVGAEKGAAQLTLISNAFKKQDEQLKHNNSTLKQHVAQLKLQAVEQRRAQQATQLATAATQKQAQANEQAARSGKLNTEAFQKFGSILSGVTPALGDFTRAIGASANSAGLLANVIMGGAGGPAGMAVGLVTGGLIGALSLWASRADDARERMKMLAEMTEEASTKVTTLAERMANIEGRKTGKAFYERIRSGDAGSTEIEALLTDRQRELARQEKAGHGSRNFAYESQLAREVKDLQGKLANARARDDIAKQVSDAERFGMIGDAPSGGGGRGGGLSAAGVQLEQLRAAGEARRELFQQQLDALSQMKQNYALRDREFTRVELDAKRAAIDAEMEAWRAAREERSEILRQQAEEEERREAAAAEKRMLNQRLMVEGLNNVGGATLSAMNKVAKGQRVTTAAFLESIGDRAAASGTAHMLEGAALSIINPAQGLPLVAAGLAEYTFGTMLGASAARAPGGSTSEARRASRGGAAGGGGYGGVEPYSPRSGSGEPETTRQVIQVTVQTLVADERAGEAAMDAIEKAHRKLGRRLSRGVMS